MYFGGVVWHFLAMFPASGRLLNKDVKDRAFKWPLFMQHELPKVMTSLLNQICMMGDKQNLNLSPQPSSNLLQVCLSQDILRRWHNVLLTFRCYRTFQESKKSNPIKCQNISLCNPKLLSLCQLKFVCRQMPLYRTDVQNIRDSDSISWCL